MTTLLALLAQAPPTTQPTGLEAFLKSPFPVLILVLVVFWWIMARGRNKERQRYEDMLKGLKKNDRVVTVGGIIGTIVDVRDDEVVLKVDEASNTKVRFTRNAIKGLLGDAAVDDKK